MFCISTQQPNPSSSRQRLLRCGGVVVLFVPLIVCLLFVTTDGMALAELPQHSRTLTYQKLTHEQEQPAPTEQTQNNPQNRTIGYEPVTPQQHRVSRPVPEPQDGSSTPRSSDNRISSRTPEELLDTSLPEPSGRITDRDIQTALVSITRQSLAVKTNGTTSPGDNLPGSPVTGNDNNTPTTPDTNTGIIIVDEIMQRQGKDNWYAIKDGDSPFPVIKIDDKYYKLDGNGNAQNQVKLRSTDPTVREEVKEDAKTTLADDQTHNAVMLIVTTMAVLAAFGIGMLAFDYKHRWEQEIVSQNSRLLGSTALHGTATHGTFAELDSLEPETLRFSSHDYGSLDDSFDHSFRTIA